MPSRFFKNVSTTASAFVALAAVAFLAAGRASGAAGALVGGFWIFLNSFFLFQLLAMGMNSRHRPKDRILLLTVLKFPVLYVAGYFILKAHFFPVSGILAGLTAFIAAFVFQWIRMNMSTIVERPAS
jgi:hypothetical protein